MAWLEVVAKRVWVDPVFHTFRAQFWGLAGAGIRTPNEIYKDHNDWRAEAIKNPPMSVAGTPIQYEARCGCKICERHDDIEESS
jgi:hypothetical protein